MSIDSAGAKVLLNKYCITVNLNAFCRLQTFRKKIMIKANMKGSL